MNSSFGENLPSFSSESEQGAHAALTELEKGLRSSKLGEQAEAIVRFPHLFSQYPFPILINSGMMKLAELFKQGSNFLKMCVLRVFQQSSLHLDKVTSVDEFLRRIITVNNSNDPVARALTLRVLGAIAQIIAERKNVHHKVRFSLSACCLSDQVCISRSAAVWTVRTRWSSTLGSSQPTSWRPPAPVSPPTCAASCWR